VHFAVFRAKPSWRRQAGEQKAVPSTYHLLSQSYHLLAQLTYHHLAPPTYLPPPGPPPGPPTYLPPPGTTNLLTTTWPTTWPTNLLTTTWHHQLTYHHLAHHLAHQLTYHLLAQLTTSWPKSLEVSHSTKHCRLEKEMVDNSFGIDVICHMACSRRILVWCTQAGACAGNLRTPAESRCYPHKL